jgi:sulfate permease, SulP family
VSRKKLWSGFTHSLRRAWTSAVAFTVDHPLDPFPLRFALDGYRRAWFKLDLKGGLDGALLAIPQGMAFAMIANLPLAYGITCSAVSCIVGALFASSRHSVFGPTNATAFMVASFFAVNPHIAQREAMPMLVFLVGALLLVGAYFKVADIAQFISRTVVVAYLAGAAVQMLVRQLPVVLGVESGDARTIFGALFDVLGALGAVQWPILAVSLFTLVSYVVLKRFRPQWPAFAMTLVAASVISMLLERAGVVLPTFASEKFTWRELLPPFPDFTGKHTSAHFSQLFGLAVSLAFLVMLENSAMARTLAGRSGHRVDANQDMFSLGAANLACAYLSGMPASNSLTRSMVNFNSGAVTPVSVIVSGLLCLAGALTLGPMVAFMPRAALGVLVMCVAASLIHPRQIRVCLRATKSDALVFVATLAATLLVPLHVAIFTGIGLSVILYLRKAGRPSLVEYEFNTEGHLAEAQDSRRQNPAISIVHVEGELFFGAAELFRSQIQRACSDPNLRIIILRLKNARHLDATSVMALEELIRQLRATGRDLVVSGAMRDVYRVLKDSGMIEVIGRENFFMGSAANPNLATRNALKRAQQILGGREADIHIFFDPRQQSGAGI